jgi:hypothetical protein
MPSDDYFKANATGITDLKTSGAALGLLERQQRLAQYGSGNSNIAASADASHAAGKQLGYSFAKLVYVTFPIWSVGTVWLLLWGLVVALLFAMGIVTDTGDIPDAWLVGTAIATAAPVLYYCRSIYAAIKVVLLFALKAAFYLAIAGVVLGIVYGIVMEVFGLW